MRNWKLWIWPGLAAVGCLTALAIWFRVDFVEKDLTSRALGALRQDHAWAHVMLDGRDLTLTGLAPDETSQVAALELARTVYGVRIATNASILLPVESPYQLSAEKTADGVVLSGFVPNEAARARIVAELSENLPGIAISDQMKLARGAPDDLLSLTGYGLSAFPRFSTGAMEISGSSLRITGQALTPDDHEAALSVLSASPPTGAVVESIDITPAALTGAYAWSAEIAQDRLTLSGFVADPDMRDGILAAAKAIRPDLDVDDQMRFASGVPEGVDMAMAAEMGLSLLAYMTEGTASVTGKVLDVSGQAVDAAAFHRIQEALSGPLEGGLVLGTSDIGVAAVSPFEWKAKLDSAGLSLSGYLPSEASRARLLEVARLKFGTLRIADDQEIAAGAPDRFEAAALTALQALSRLEDAEAHIVDGDVSVQGAALSEAGTTDVGRLLSEGLPQGFVSDPRIELAAVPETALPVSACQDELNRLAMTNSVLFEIGDSAIQDHSYGFLDRIAFAARRCGSARLEISGHTDSDGADAANLALSELRARSVLDFMTAAGVAADRMSAIGYGESRPVKSNETDAGKAANRRIEFRVLN